MDQGTEKSLESEHGRKDRLMNRLKVILAAAIVAAAISSAVAVPTLTISDGVTSTTLTDPSGVITFGTTLDSFWNVLIITGETKPAIGTATSPQLDLNIQASSTAGSPNLTITLSDRNFGPTTGTFSAQLTGSVIAGPGQNVTFNTFYDAANVTSATTTALTSTNLPPPSYNSPLQVLSGPFSQPLYSLTEVITIGGSQGASGLYHFDASLSLVPEPGSSCLLLSGAAILGIWRRRK